MAYNQGVEEAIGKYIILTSPEVRHEMDILSGLDKEFEVEENKYVVCGCKSLRKGGGFQQWFQHSEHRNELFHFCTAIKRSLFLSFGGFDKAYADGYCFDDNDLVWTIRDKKIPITVRDDLMTSHQFHLKNISPKEKWRRNRTLFISKWGEGKL
jgi:GT2 family glycosyltransferase